MTRWIHAALGLGAALLAAPPAAAQTISTTPRNPARWDAGGSVGWFTGNKDDIADDWNDWYDTFAVSLDAGRYWTPHLKTEASATFAGEGSVYGQEQVAIPVQPFFIYRFREHHFRVAAISAAAVYQFLENSWVHPFVSAGVSLGWERERSLTQRFVPTNDRPFFPPILEETRETSFDAWPFVGGGFKFYASERVFIRTDVNTAFDSRGLSRATWRVGIGMDF